MTDTAQPIQGKDLLRPIVGIENRTPQEVFDIMCDRIRAKFVRRDDCGHNGGVTERIADPQRCAAGRLRAVVMGFVSLERSIKIDIASAHSLRGVTASSEKREDDAEFRSDLETLFEVARGALPHLSEERLAPPFQARVHEWMLECFGPEIEADRQERADRFIEEALELAQTMPGFTAARAHALVDYVFGRPVGERAQEIGGVMVTLAALCNTVGLQIDEEAERELGRVWTKIDAIRAKQAAKPTGSPLPAPSPQSDEVKTLRAAIEQAAMWFDHYGADHERKAQRTRDAGERAQRADKARRNYERASSLRRVLFPGEEGSE